MGWKPKIKLYDGLTSTINLYKKIIKVIMSKKICIILARGGSKRIPGKKY